MIEIQFIFKNKKHIIKCENSDKIRDICENFAKEVSLDIDNLIFFDNGIKLNLEMDLYVEQQFNLEKNTNYEVRICSIYKDATSTNCNN